MAACTIQCITSTMLSPCGILPETVLISFFDACYVFNQALLSPPGRDGYFLVKLSAQESTHRAFMHHKNVALRSAAKFCFLLWSKVLIRAETTQYFSLCFYITNLVCIKFYSGLHAQDIKILQCLCSHTGRESLQASNTLKHLFTTATVTHCHKGIAFPQTKRAVNVGKATTIKRMIIIGQSH
jgi:hypothetical protein